jgi:hypothetical protein
VRSSCRRERESGAGLLGRSEIVLMPSPEYSIHFIVVTHAGGTGVECAAAQGVESELSGSCDRPDLACCSVLSGVKHERGRGGERLA